MIDRMRSTDHQSWGVGVATEYIFGVFASSVGAEHIFRVIVECRLRTSQQVSDVSQSGSGENTYRPVNARLVHSRRWRDRIA